MPQVCSDLPINREQPGAAYGSLALRVLYFLVRKHRDRLAISTFFLAFGCLTINREGKERDDGSEGEVEGKEGGIKMDSRRGEERERGREGEGRRGRGEGRERGRRREGGMTIERREGGKWKAGKKEKGKEGGKLEA